MQRIHAYLLSDKPGAAYAFAGTIMGGTFMGIVALSAVALAIMETVR